MGAPRAGAGCATRNDSATSAQVIDGSLRIMAGLQNTAYATYLTRTPSTDGNRQTYTISVWCRRNQLKGMPLGNGYDANTYALAGANDFKLLYESSVADALTAVDSTASMDVTTNAVYRDVSAWYHVVLAVDTTQGTNTNRVKLYVNGEQQTSLGTATYPAEDAEGDWGDASYAHYLARTGSGDHFDGNLCQYYFIDGQQLAASDFGYTDLLTNTWRPKRFTGSYGTVGGTPTTGTLLNYNSNTALPTYSNQGGASQTGNPVSYGFDGDASTWANMTYLNGQWSKLTFGTAITNVTKIVVGYDGEGDVGYNGSVVNSSVGYTGSRQTITLRDSSAVTLTDLYFVSQPGNGVCRLYDITITTTGVAATELTFTQGVANNSFYLPMDGSGPIGQDQSGNRNDWEPVNFIGASAPLDKATGALPILSTVNGGNVATAGVRTDANSANLVLALPLNVDEGKDYSNLINSGTSQKSLTWTTISNQTISNFYGQSCQFGTSTGQNHAVVVATSSDFTLGTGAFTIECWVYSTDSGGTQNIFQAYQSGSNYYGMYISSGNLYMYLNAGTSNNLGSTVPGDDRWVHLAYVRDGSNNIYCFVDGVNRVSGVTDSTNLSDASYVVYVGRHQPTTNALVGYMQDFRMYKGVAKYTENFIPASTDPDVQPASPSGTAYSSKLTQVTDGSVAFDGSGDYLTLASNSDLEMGTENFTLEMWVYSTDSSTDTQDRRFFATEDNAASSIQVGHINTTSGNVEYADQGNANVRVTGTTNVLNRWAHVAVVRNSGTVSLYIDGVSEGTPATDNNSKTADTPTIGRYPGASGYFAGHLSNLRLLKGTALYTSNFTPPTRSLTNVTNTKLLCCQDPRSATAYAVAPGAITANGDAAADFNNPFNTDTDTVIGRPTKYATWNPLWMGTSNVAMNEGNLVYFTTSNGPDHCTYSTIGMDSGKFYWENEIIEATATAVGIANNLADPDAGPGQAHNWMYYSATGQVYLDNNASTYGEAYNTNGIMIGVAFDRDNLTLEFFREGISQGKLTGITGLTDTETYYAMCGDSGGASQSKIRGNFGQKPFKYTPPDGFGPLVEADQTTPPVVRSDQYFGVQVYEGNGVSPRTIDGFKFAPDLIWYKEISVARDWQSYDTVRGAGTNKNLTFNTIYAENGNDDEQYGYTSAFNDKGWVLTDGSAGSGNGDIYTNDSGQDYVAYAWKAGGSTNTFNIDGQGYSSAAAAGLDGGDISPSGASINTKAGFSILKYTGNGSNAQAINHGLGEIPDFVICKNLGTNYNWFIWHEAFGNNANAAIYFTDAAKTTGYGTQPFGTFTTSSLVFNGVNDGVCGSYNYICWAWKNVPGVQKFGSYTGNGNANGPYIECGFRPAMVFYKRTTDQTQNWQLYDDQQNPRNQASTRLSQNLSTEAVTGNGCDILSNGFKIRNSDSADNSDGKEWIYCAWAAAPSGGLYGGQSNAR